MTTSGHMAGALPTSDKAQAAKYSGSKTAGDQERAT
ncbi:hypothetical protein FHR33_009970 [Nonomuraea dietziae]|uniref:Uncharacterized protein n=1 Tax=Nonomuraea dietziae TaxID=65515 RepID=A0A7W5YTF2_9ACTN|nr:hypothetical protein [Nonomuraea dietziae]